MIDLECAQKLQGIEENINVYSIPKPYLTSALNNTHFGIIFVKENIVTHMTPYAIDLLEDLTGKPLPFSDEFIYNVGYRFDGDVLKNDKLISLNISITEISPTEYMWIIIDINQRVAVREELLHQKHLAEYHAYYDDLTELPNRNKCILDMENLIKDNKQFYILFTDIDSFKFVNDTFGHNVGNEVLKLLAKRLKLLFPDCKAYRLSGDEFAVIGEGGKEIGVRCAQRLIKENAVSLDYNYTEYLNNIYITTSIGVCEYPKDGTDINSLLGHVDIAMYHSKQLSKNTFTAYSPKIKTDKLRELTLQNDILDSIDRDHFELYYQPQIDSRNGELVGLEGLIRWNHPEKGFINLCDFIPLAEKTGIIKKLGDYILRKGLIEARYIKNTYNYHKKVSLNVSSKQLDNSFVKFVRKLVENCNSEDCAYKDCNSEDCAYKDCTCTERPIKLEITETDIMLNFQDNIDGLKEIDDMGVQIQIDDFGTGYSSLSYLDAMPVKAIKIDKKFIDKIGGDTKILDTIISLAKSMDLDIIAEGVEELYQVEYLTKKEVFCIQGFYYDKPMKLKDLENKYFKVQSFKTSKFQDFKVSRLQSPKEGSTMKESNSINFDFSFLAIVILIIMTLNGPDGLDLIDATIQYIQSSSR